MEGRGHGISLWLVPGSPSLERLTALVSGLAARHGTPAFLPHVTLIHGLAGEEADLVAKAGTLAARLSSLRVGLGPVAGRDEYFRCLYLRAEPEGALRAAHERAAEAFGRAPDPEFLPHLSLLYGRLAPEGKQRIAESVTPELPDGFEATALQVWRTEGTVAEWARRASFALRGGQMEASNSSSARRKERGSTAG